MMHLPKPSGDSFVQVSGGTHLAVCYRIIDLGTQETKWGEETKRQRKVMISWELPHEPMMEDGRPMTASKRYTFSSHEKSALRKDLESWRGKAFTDADFGEGGFELKNILGRGCQLTIVHNEKGYANIESVSGLMKGSQSPQPINPVVCLSLEPGEFDQKIFDELSDRLKETIAKSPEYQALKDTRKVRPASTDVPFDDEIPF